MLRTVGFVVSVAIVASSAASATDVPITGRKLVIIDKVTIAGQAKVVSVGKGDPGIAKGMAGDPALLAGRFQVYYSDGPTSAGGSFVLPSPWSVNTNGVAKFGNREAPAGPSEVKIAVVKPGRLAKVVARGLGGLDVSTPPGVGGVTTVLTVDNGNDGSSTRMCTRYSLGDGSSVVYRAIAGGLGVKLALKNGVGAACPPLNVCGNGVLEPTEECDDGNLADGDCCSSTCTEDADGTGCTDHTGCTTGDTCLAGVCGGDLIAPWINEIDYDSFDGFPNDDRDEFVEIAGPAGLDLSGYQIVSVEGFDGSCGTPFFAAPGSAHFIGIIPNGRVLGDDTGTGVGFYVACFTYTSTNVGAACDDVLPGVATDSNLKNGDLLNGGPYCPDGVLLLEPGGGFVDAVSWEGIVINAGPYGPFFHINPYSAGTDAGFLAQESLKKVTSTLAAATSATDWALSGAGNHTPGSANPPQVLACGP